ncbi:MAG: MFS transporter, partial [Clostridia bacterium]|nr:MFS transporter [Clostridia bacterium]
MSIRTSHKHTLTACYLGYITQAIVNNFAPLLFLTFSTDYDIPLSQMAMLVAVNFGVQILVDLIAAKYMNVWGYRPSVVAAHVFAVLGLVGLGLLPRLLPVPFAGILIAI